jgi:hypothetical protein
MSQTFIIKTSTPTSMKVMDRTDDRAMRAYLSKKPEETHTNEELAALHRAIEYTHKFKMDESNQKMEEEEFLYRPSLNLRNFGHLK